MSAQMEHESPPAVVRVIELMGVSDKSWSDAAQQIVARASKTLRHITGLEVVRSSAAIRDGKIVEYHVRARVAFVLEAGHPHLASLPPELIGAEPVQGWWEE